MPHRAGAGSQWSAPLRSFLDAPAPGVALDHPYLNTDPGALDLLGRITGVGDHARVARDAVEIELFGRCVRAIGLDDLIAAKEALCRDKDLIATVELRGFARSCESPDGEATAVLHRRRKHTAIAHE